MPKAQSFTVTNKWRLPTRKQIGWFSKPDFRSMQLQYAQVIEAVVGTSNFREIADVAFTAGSDAASILNALQALGIASPGPNTEIGISNRSQLVSLPKGRLLNDPDWSGHGVMVWILTKH